MNRNGNIRNLVGVAMLVFAAAPGSSWSGPVPAPEGEILLAQGSGDKPMSPAARRSFIRDSLRQERLKTQAQAAATVQDAGPGNANAPSGTPGSGAGANPSQSNVPLAVDAQVIAGSVEPASVVVPSTAPKVNVELPISDSLMVKALNVRNTEIRDVLQGLGIQYGVNIVLAPEVAGPITVNLSKIKVKDALRIIAEENGYQLSVVHGAVKVEKRAAPKPAEPPPPRFLVSFAENRLSVDLQKIPAEEVVRRLMEATGKNIILDQNASVDLSAHFKDLELRKGLALLSETNGLTVREKDGVYTFSRQAWSSGAKDAAGAPANTGPMRVTVKDKLVSMEVTSASLSDIISNISAQTGIS
nr:hypothetical protein [Fibrobacterota bacterium]